MSKDRFIGFGYNATWKHAHFHVAISPKKVQFAEVFNCPIYNQPQIKAILTNDQWQQIRTVTEVELNARLLHYKLKQGLWKEKGEVCVEHMLGKELMVLVWAIESTSDPTKINRAIARWLAFRPEERWWLYTTTNATYPHPDHGPERGWRKALKVALTED